MKNKNTIIIIIVIVVVAVIAFMYLSQSNSADNSASFTSGQKSAEFASAKEILALLNRMSQVRLEDGIFNNRAFQGLRDTTVVLTSQPLGRNNPFSPLGSDGMRAVGTSTGTR